MNPQERAAISTLIDVRKLPYGLAHTTAATAALERVEAERLDSVLAFALFVQTEAYIWGGEVAKAYEPFTRMLRWWDEHPEHFDASDEHSLFWSFKWMVAHLMRFPEVPAAQIDATVDDMERRYALAGNGMNAVFLSKFEWAEMRGYPDVEAAFRSWVSQPRDDFSQCEACQPGDEARYFLENGRADEAIRLIENTLAQHLTCATEPADTHSLAQLAYLYAGDAAAAARAHRRTLQTLPPDIEMASAKGRVIEFLGRSGNPQQALRYLQAYQEHLTWADTPFGRMWFLARVVAGLTPLLATDGEHFVELTSAPSGTVRDIHAWAHQQALDLAAAFDKRNGTTHVTERVRAQFATGEHTFDVDLSVFASTGSAADAGTAAGTGSDKSAAGTNSTAGNKSTASDESTAGDGKAGTVAAAAARSDDDVSLVPGAQTLDPEALIDKAEGLTGEDAARAAQLYAQAAAAFESAGFLESAGFAYAEAGQLAAQERDDDGARTAFRRAVSLIKAAGTRPQFLAPVIRAWAKVTHDAADQRDVRAAAELATEALRTLISAHGDTDDADGAANAVAQAERRAQEREERLLRDCVARLDATAGSYELAARSAEQVAEEFARAGEIRDAGYAFWLAGSCWDALGAADQAVFGLESAFDGFALVPDRSAAMRVGDELVGLLNRLGRPDDARRIAERIAE